VKVEIAGGNTVVDTVLLSVLEIQADYRIDYKLITNLKY